MTTKPTSPNISILKKENNYQQVSDLKKAIVLLKSIAIKNKLLAIELGKLPELQGEINHDDIKALKMIHDVYKANQESFDLAFAKMYEEGNSEVRRYCTPLQVVFWLAKENYFKNHQNIISNYSLKYLLDLAWNGPKEVCGVKLLKIIHEYRDDDYRKEMLLDFSELPLDLIKDFIIQDYNYSPERFTDTGKNYIKALMDGYAKEAKWDDYQTVIERINSPELVNSYINKFITYRNFGQYAHGAYLTVKRGWGHCTDAAYLVEAAMKLAGYKTFMRSVRWGPDNKDQVHTGSGIVFDDGKYLLVGDFGVHRANHIGGPYESIEEVDYRLSRGKKITQRGWGAFYPPR